MGPQSREGGGGGGLLAIIQIRAGGPSCNSPNTSGGGGALANTSRGLAINTFQVGDETLAACFVTYSIHQGVLSAFHFSRAL